LRRERLCGQPRERYERTRAGGPAGSGSCGRDRGVSNAGDRHHCRAGCAALRRGGGQQFKTLLYVGDGKLFAVIVRGGDELEEAKLGALGFTLWRPATPEEIEPVMGAKPGSLGAVRGTIKNPEALAGVYATRRCG